MEKIIHTAIELAKKSTMRKRYACIITLNGNIIGTGYNIQKEYSRHELDQERYSYHAERNAIISIKNHRFILKQCKVYIIRIDNQGNVYPAIPCELCCKFLKRNGIKGIYTIL